MDKDQAIQEYHKITGGTGLDRNKYQWFLDNCRGRIAKKFWNDDCFSLGFEYGFLYCLIDIFDLTYEDLKIKNDYE